MSENTTGKEQAGPGRPIVATVEERREIILGVAQAAFMESGFRQTSMERIAKDSGMSKRTLYEIYPDKEKIFKAVLARRVDPPPAIPADPSRSPRAELLDYLTVAATYALGDAQIAMLRLVISEANTLPEISETQYLDSLGVVVGLVAERLEAYQTAGQIPPCDSAFVADMLVGATVGPGIIRKLVSPDTHPVAAIDAIKVRAGRVLDAFGMLQTL